MSTYHLYQPGPSSKEPLNHGAQVLERTFTIDGHGGDRRHRDGPPERVVVAHGRPGADPLRDDDDAAYDDLAKRGLTRDGFEGGHGGRTRLWEFTKSSASLVCEGGNMLVVPEAEDGNDDDGKRDGDRRPGVEEEFIRGAMMRTASGVRDDDFEITNGIAIVILDPKPPTIATKATDEDKDAEEEDDDGNDVTGRKREGYLQNNRPSPSAPQRNVNRRRKMRTIPKLFIFFTCLACHGCVFGDENEGGGRRVAHSGIRGLINAAVAEPNGGDGVGSKIAKLGEGEGNKVVRFLRTYQKKDVVYQIEGRNRVHKGKMDEIDDVVYQIEGQNRAHKKKKPGSPTQAGSYPKPPTPGCNNKKKKRSKCNKPSAQTLTITTVAFYSKNNSGRRVLRRLQSTAFEEVNRIAIVQLLQSLLPECVTLKNVNIIKADISGEQFQVEYSKTESPRSNDIIRCKSCRGPIFLTSGQLK
ncbi:hypothetical protein ACHAW5_000086 [Stephanodiscus triporus]|uniref:Uncharacterized protein n=1 Tax=Stephanodiscus triporus TaxID=2934178 RepID=A0ABD3QWD2_9STRA